ncbi:hypothetical protein FRB94_007480 [Tulasnella sp. JGI-2019a]|nr:hypothetical protein FRB93_003640 [Tulasnella sp. JGI-2019a]KAG8997758.1 hypothetical protein FRB94_007480 [Tulasnella sp. JGI-2019a]
MSAPFLPSTPARAPHKLRAPRLNFSPLSAPSLSPTSSVSSLRSSPTSSCYSSSPTTPNHPSPLRGPPLYSLASRFPVDSSDSVSDSMFSRSNSVRSRPCLTADGSKSTATLGSVSIRHGGVWEDWESQSVIADSEEGIRSPAIPIISSRLRGHAYSNSNDSFSSMTAASSIRSSEDTLVDDVSGSSFRMPGKLWARPWNSDKGKVKNAGNANGYVGPLAPSPMLDSDIDMEDWENMESDSDDDDDDDMMMVPDNMEFPKSFQPPELTVRNGSRQLRCMPWEIPYPLSYDKVLMDADDHTHELVKALIPTRNGLSFHEFAKSPSAILDLGCGEGRWVVEAAAQWKNARIVGLDLMDIQYELSGKCFDDVRDRIQWVQTNFLEYQLPFKSSTFDYIRMSHVALAIPAQNWKHVIYEIRRVLKRGGVLEWIDEEPIIPLSPATQGSEGLKRPGLEAEFKSLIRSRKFRKPVATVTKLLKGRAVRMNATHVKKIRLGLPPPGTALRQRNPNAYGSVRSSPANSLRKGKPGADYFSTMDDENDHVAPSSTNRYMPPGLVVLPEGKLLPLAPSDVTTQATHNSQIVLGAAEAMWSRRVFNDPTASREQFEKEIWEYEQGRYSRLHLPSALWDDFNGDTATPPTHQPHSLATLNHRRRAPLSLLPLSPSIARNPMIVRSLFVLISISD